MNPPSTPSALPDLEEVIRRATAGDRASLEHLAHALQSDIFGLSLRMLGNRQEAEDATQEILVRVVTRLAQFDGRSTVRTWAYRVAVNYILDLKKSAGERLRRTFDEMADELGEVSSNSSSLSEVEESLYIDEIKAGCTLGMLQCLDLSHRAAFVLGQLLELSSPEAAAVLDISPELFRKRLQEARSAVSAFMQAHCGLVSDSAPCRCNRLFGPLQRAGKLQTEVCPSPPLLSSFHKTRALVRQVEKAQWALEVHRSTPIEGSTIDFARRLMDGIALHLDEINDPSLQALSSTAGVSGGHAH